MSNRRDHDAGFKARVAPEAVKGERTVSERVAEHGVHGGQPPAVMCWNRIETDQRDQGTA